MGLTFLVMSSANPIIRTKEEKKIINKNFGLKSVRNKLPKRIPKNRPKPPIRGVGLI